MPGADYASSIILPSLAGGQSPQQCQRCAAKTEVFNTTRDRKCLLKAFDSVSVFKDLYGHPVLRRDGGHVGSVLSPHMVGVMKSGNLWNKKRTGLLLMCIPVL
jgi:hypothetical protein